jgi:hypothetical protein
MINKLTATLTATRPTISPSTKIITHGHPPERDHGGPPRTLQMDLRIRCVFQAPPRPTTPDAPTCAGAPWPS